MRRIYRNPPLIEALCEFQFQAGQPWDWTVSGRVYERVQGEYPKKRHQPMTESLPQEAHGCVARMLFLSDDERLVMQVAPDLLAVNQLQPQTEWRAFRSVIQRALAVYHEVAQPAQIQRMGLRYINRIELPNLLQASRYVCFLPQVPADIPHAPEAWALRVDIPYSEGEYLRLQSAALTHAPAIVLDIEFATEQLYNPQADDWLRWLERAHTIVGQVFEASITPTAREAFGEEESYE